MIALLTLVSAAKLFPEIVINYELILGGTLCLIGGIAKKT